MASNAMAENSGEVASRMAPWPEPSAAGVAMPIAPTTSPPTTGRSQPGLTSELKTRSVFATMLISAMATPEQRSATSTICAKAVGASESPPGGLVSRLWSTNSRDTSVETTALAAIGASEATL
ncbi:MAG: hypothetical protein H6872_08805 [Methylobacteriaceae bacterium]|nr:hypothetical protein [Methylobacteriaceae bacterium]